MRHVATVLILLALAPVALAAHCTGADDCTVCTPCSSGAHCADGGTCGVKRRAGASPPAPASGEGWRRYVPSLGWFGAAAGGATLGAAGAR